MKDYRMGWVLAIGGGVVLSLMAAGCGSMVGPWTRTPAGSTLQYASPDIAPPAQESCDEGTKPSARVTCVLPWLEPL